MNILIPDSWLREFVDTPASAEEIARLLSLSGPSVERIHSIADEPVYDIEVTTNRVDMMSVIGIAREVATILPANQIPARFLAPSQATIEYPPASFPLTVHDPDHLARSYAGIAMSLETLASTPDWMITRLTQVGQRSLNLLVDVSNYLTWELGFPVHIFDLDALGNYIGIQRAKAGDSLVTLDGKTRVLAGGEVIFVNQKEEIIDLPAIMGTSNTAITDQSKRILIWSESLLSKDVRAASMGLGIRTQAAILNEKHVDPSGTKVVVEAAAALLSKLTGARPLSSLEHRAATIEAPAIGISTKQVERFLGISMSLDSIADILNKLGFETHIDSDTCLAKAPSYRQHDIESSVDLVEEIARIYGYHNLNGRLPDTLIPNQLPDPILEAEYKLKHLLAGWGWSEVYTYSLVSLALAEQSGFPVEQHLTLANPLTEDLEYLRRSLLPSHQQLLASEPLHGEHGVFEMAHCYHPRTAQLPLETLMLTLSIDRAQYSKLTTALQSLLKSLRIHSSLVPSTHTAYLPDQVLEVMAGTTPIGRIGLTTHHTAHIELEVATLLKAATPPRFTPMPSHAPVVEDLTLTFPEKTLIGIVLGVIPTLHASIHKVSYLGKYQRNHSFRIEYLDSHTQLTSEAVRPIREQIIQHLESSYQAVLVGNR